MSDITESREKRLKDLMKVTAKEVGDSRAMMGDDPRLYLGILPTDIPVLDNILDGGFRRGRMALIIGEASMGKTLLTQWVMKAAQARDMIIGFIDPEKTFDSGWFDATGVDASKIIVVRPTTTEQAFDVAVKWAEARMDLIVIDSLASLTPKARLEKGLDEAMVIGRAAHAANEGINMLLQANTDSLILITNQLRSKIGGYGNPETLPAGLGQEYYATYKLRVRRAGWIGGDKLAKRTGYQVKITAEKNKANRPFGTCLVPFYFTGVIDLLSGLLDIGVDLDLIEKKGAWFVWDDEKFHGMDNLKEYFEDNPEEQARLKDLIENSDLDTLEEFVEEEWADET